MYLINIKYNNKSIMIHIAVKNNKYQKSSRHLHGY